MLKTLRPPPQRCRLKCKSNLNIFRQRKEEEKKKKEEKKKRKKKKLSNHAGSFESHPGGRLCCRALHLSVGAGRGNQRRTDTQRLPRGAQAQAPAWPRRWSAGLEKPILQGLLLSAPCPL